MLKYYEKLSITIVLFLGVVIATSFIIGNYIKVTKEKEPPKTNDYTFVLD